MREDFFCRLRLQLGSSIECDFALVSFIFDNGVRINDACLADVLIDLAFYVVPCNWRKFRMEHRFNPEARVPGDPALLALDCLFGKNNRLVCADVGSQFKMLLRSFIKRLRPDFKWMNSVFC